MTLEDLTKEELIYWVRENIPGIDEESVVEQFLYSHQMLAWEKYTEAYEQYELVNNQVIELVQRYADGPVKPGVRLREWPKEAQEEYERLDFLRKTAQEEKKAWFGQHTDIANRIIRNYRERLEKQREKFFQNLNKIKIRRNVMEFKKKRMIETEIEMTEEEYEFFSSFVAPGVEEKRKWGLAFLWVNAKDDPGWRGRLSPEEQDLVDAWDSALAQMIAEMDLEDQPLQ